LLPSDSDRTEFSTDYVNPSRQLPNPDTSIHFYSHREQITLDVSSSQFPSNKKHHRPFHSPLAYHRRRGSRQQHHPFYQKSERRAQALEVTIDTAPCADPAAASSRCTRTVERSRVCRRAQARLGSHEDGVRTGRGPPQTCMTMTNNGDGQPPAWAVSSSVLLVAKVTVLDVHPASIWSLSFTSSPSNVTLPEPPLTLPLPPAGYDVQVP